MTQAQAPTRNSTPTGQKQYPTYTPPTSTPIDLSGMFQGTPYADSPELANILKDYTSSSNSWSGYTGGNTSADWASGVKSTIDQYSNTFQQMFKNQVGRDPTAEEYDTFFKQVVTPDSPWTKPADMTLAKQETKGLLSDVYSGAAQVEATKKLQDQANAALAPGGAFDTWQNAYRGNVNSTTQALQDYQSKLFEKIRPQLLTSLKSQGLLDTGGMNEAMAGVEGDLANTGSMYAANLEGQANQDIANQRYAIQSNPGNFQMNATAGNPGMMVSQGQNALQNVWSNYMQNQQFNQQRDMYNMQANNQPSLLQQYGGMMLGGATGGLAQGLGNAYGNSFFKTPAKTAT